MVDHRTVDIAMEVGIFAHITTEKVDTNTAELTDPETDSGNVAYVKMHGTEEECAAMLRVLAARLERDQ